MNDNNDDRTFQQQQNDSEFAVSLRRRLLVRKIITVGIVAAFSIAIFIGCMIALGSGFTV